MGSSKIIILMGLALGGLYTLCELRARENVESSARLEESVVVEAIKLTATRAKADKKSGAPLKKNKRVKVKQKKVLVKNKKIKKRKKPQKKIAVPARVLKAPKKIKKSIKAGKKLAAPVKLPTIKSAAKKDVVPRLGAEQAEPTVKPPVKKEVPKEKVQKIPDIKGSSCKLGSVTKSDEKTVACICQLSKKEATCTIAQGTDKPCDPCAGLPTTSRVYLPDRLSNCKNCKADDADKDLTCECDSYTGGRESYTLKDYKTAYKKCRPGTDWSVTYHPKHTNTLMCAHFEKIDSTDSVDGCDRGTVKHQRVTFVDGTVNVTGTQCHCPHDKDRMCYTVELGKSKCSPCRGWYSADKDKLGCKKGTVQWFKNPATGKDAFQAKPTSTQCECVDQEEGRSSWWPCKPGDCTPSCPITMKVADRPGCKKGTVTQLKGKLDGKVDRTFCKCEADPPGTGFHDCTGDCIPQKCGKFKWVPAPNDFPGCKLKSTKYLTTKDNEIHYTSCICKDDNIERHMSVTPPQKTWDKCTANLCAPTCPQWFTDDPDKQRKYQQCKYGTVQVYRIPTSTYVQKRRCICKDTGKEVTCDGDCPPNCPTWLLTSKSYPRCQSGTVAQIGGDNPQTGCFCAIADDYGTDRRTCDGLDCMPQCKGNVRALNEFCVVEKKNDCSWVCADKTQYNDYYQTCKKKGGMITGNKCCYYDTGKMECGYTGKYYHCVGKHDPSEGQPGDYCTASSICDGNYICRNPGGGERRCMDRCTSNDDCKKPLYEKNGWTICNWASSTSHRRYGACDTPKKKGKRCYGSNECFGKLVCRQENGDQCNSYKPASEGGCDGTCVKGADFGGACKNDGDCRYANEVGCIHGKCRYKCKHNKDCQKDGTVPATNGWTTCHWDMKDATKTYGHCASPRDSWSTDKYLDWAQSCSSKDLPPVCYDSMECGNSNGKRGFCSVGPGDLIGQTFSVEAEKGEKPSVFNQLLPIRGYGQCWLKGNVGDTCHSSDGSDCSTGTCMKQCEEFYDCAMMDVVTGICTKSSDCKADSDCSAQDRCLKIYRDAGCGDKGHKLVGSGCAPAGKEGHACSPGTCGSGLSCIYLDSKHKEMAECADKCTGVCIPTLAAGDLLNCEKRTS